MTIFCHALIDAFHRQLLRQLLKIHYPNIMTNTDVYAMTRHKDIRLLKLHFSGRRRRQHLLTDKINQDKLRFTGHILRLPEGTPARQALQIAIKPVTRPRGRQKTTWIQFTNTLLLSVDLDYLGTDKLQESYRWTVRTPAYLWHAVGCCLLHALLHMQFLNILL